MNILTRSNFILAFWRTGSLSDFDTPPARTMDSRKSKSAFSHLCPNEYLSFLGKLTEYS